MPSFEVGNCLVENKQNAKDGQRQGNPEEAFCLSDDDASADDIENVGKPTDEKAIQSK